MDGASMNRYEEQLYSVFKTFDVDNKEALDRPAVLELCDALQLEERGATLVDTLFERRADRVTFTQFRNGLLTVLGGEPPAPPAPHAQPAPHTQPAPTASSAPPHSDDDSSGREVAPKFVFGSKKYGRRSRPQHPTSGESPRHRVASDSRLEGERARQRMRCKRSASAMESREVGSFSDDEEPVDLDHDRRVDRERALALCRSLRMHSIDHRIIERIFDDSTTGEITVGEFFDRLNSSLTSSIAASLDGRSSLEEYDLQDLVDVVTSDVVIEAWEQAGVHRPRRLLLELGFSAAALRPADLERALDEEIQALPGSPEDQPDARALLLLAAHTVARLRSDHSRRRLDVAIAERDKLRADLAEANRRARLLAQEVDENHARIEADLKASLRQLEARHAEATRVAAAETAAERERAAAARARLEEELARRADSEGRLRTEAASLQNRNEELQSRAQTLEARAAAAEREAARLAAEARAAGGGGAAAADGERRAAAALAARLHALQREAAALRDRNDELSAALEAAARRTPHAAAPAAPPAASASWREEADDSLLLRPPTEECDSSLHSIDQKVLDCNKVVKNIQAIFDKIQRIQVPKSESCESCGTLESTIALIQKEVKEFSESNLLSEQSAFHVEPAIDVGLQTESGVCEEVETLQRELTSIREKHQEEKENLSSVIKELESSLEQMKVEYDKCEEYWMNKMEEEREIFSEEQRAGDERLAELVAKIGEYERQFAAAAPAPLPPIDERRGLEAQVTALEEEFAAFRAARDAELAAARDQVARLSERLERLQAAAAGGCGAGAAAAGALRARAARAERAAQRLHARLAAADLLVKDLYIENCRLAHLPHGPHAPHGPHGPHAPPRLP